MKVAKQCTYPPVSAMLGVSTLEPEKTCSHPSPRQIPYLRYLVLTLACNYNMDWQERGWVYVPDLHHLCSCLHHRVEYFFCLT